MPARPRGVDMKTIDNKNIANKVTSDEAGEKGSAIVIALLIMVLLLGFVALAVTRTTSETISAANDAAESRAFEVAHASLEYMTRNFKKVFDIKLNAEPSDLSNIMTNLPPGFDDYDIVQNIHQSQNAQQVVMTGGDFQGLSSTRDEWEIRATVTHKATGVQVALTRRFFNDRIPIFQFGIFYDDNLEFHPGPKFDFGGRVHSNANLFLMANTGLYFSSKVTAQGEIFTDTGRNGQYTWSDNVFIKKADGAFKKLARLDGSVLKTKPGTPHVFTSPNDPDLPPVNDNTDWPNVQKSFQGNLKSNQPRLDLPIKKTGTYIEMIKRGKEVGDLASSDINENGTLEAGEVALPVNSSTKDPEVAKKERYYNKPGIRVSLADSKAKLPGCATPSGAAVATPCGVILNGRADGTPGTDAGVRGYDPGLPANKMTDYTATRLNGNRFYPYTGNEQWIKVEAVGFDATTSTVTSMDITKEILSLGVTEESPQWCSGTERFCIDGYGTNDSRSVLKLQRFIFGDKAVPSTLNSYLKSNITQTRTIDSTSITAVYNYVLARTGTTSGYLPAVLNSGMFRGEIGDNPSHLIRAQVKDDGTAGKLANRSWVAAFPINMFDSREGIYNAGMNTGTNYGTGNNTKVPWNGVMSVVDVDVANLRKFLNGDFNGRFPSGTPFATAAGHTLTSNDIPQANGWVLYLSDRRGDKDFDGQFDMEDVLGNNGTLEPGEDVNGNGILEKDYYDGMPNFDGFEGAKYLGSVFPNLLPTDTTMAIWNSAQVIPEIAASYDHRYFRRTFRLMNGTVLPGRYDSATPANTKGFTVASENGVYVLGNYNATNIVGSSNPTPPEDYRPINTQDHIPASIAADAVTILSRRWNDGQSFNTPYTSQTAMETTVRFAMIAGDSRSSFLNSINQGGGDPNLSGGVHNFKRFLENWSNIKMNYAGSIINLYNAQNSNGAFKNDGKVYSPPNRNWIFDTSFLDPNRLPPGTPFFQAVQLTGFQRLN